MHNRFCGDPMHQEPQIDIGGELQPERGRFNFALMLAAAAVLIIAAALYFWSGRQSPPDGAPRGSRFAFGAGEQAYAPKIGLENIALSRAENFLHQEVTTLSGELVNNGDRPVRGVEVTIEFFDEMSQIALRERHAVLVPDAPPLAPGDRRSFEVSFEHIPSSWNMQQPQVHITGLQL
jgi:hypothetical protein